MENTVVASTTSQILNKNIVSENVEQDEEDRIAENSAQSSAEKPKSTRAIVYQFFEWVNETNQYKCSICEYVCCLVHVSMMIANYYSILMFCRKQYSVPKSGGTGSLNNHMNRKHKTIFDNAKNVKAVADGRTIPSSSAPLKITSEMFRHKIVMFMICSDQPFTLVEDEFFRDLINYCSSENKECQLFCAKTAKRSIEALYNENKLNKKEILENNDGKISFVIDCWTSSNQLAFQGVIARWINDNWELCQTVLDLTVLKGSHEGINIAAAFWNVLKEFCLCAKMLSVTTDNAFNMDTMFLELEKLASQCGISFDSKNYRVRCFAHIMNLSARSIIQSVGDGDVKEYPSDSESEDEDGENVKKRKDLPVIVKLRKGIVAIRRSPQRRELFFRQCVAAGIHPKIVIRDVRTRWNATHAMTERAKELKTPYDLTLRSIPKLRKYVLLDEEWEKIDELLAILAPFQEATVMLSNEHSPTISRIASVYQVLFNHLEKYTKAETRDTESVPSKRMKRNSIRMYPSWLVEAAQRGLDKLEKYYPTSDGLVYIVATGDSI